MARITSVGKYGRKAGFREGDELVSLGGVPVGDVLDCLYFDGEERFDAEIVRGGKRRTLHVRRRKSGNRTRRRNASHALPEQVRVLLRRPASEGNARHSLRQGRRLQVQFRQRQLRHADQPLGRGNGEDNPPPPQPSLHIRARVFGRRPEEAGGKSRHRETD